MAQKRVPARPIVFAAGLSPQYRPDHPDYNRTGVAQQ
eukprot:CAMPEP_0177761412 /NCGR_PEP_ID=MMETSP0491_2-20121128/5791_1 /TAXON_ID=63592 /ORGANISM="Tetraselmis chuii, Strain PLY429" /LENGTH=36 /DNA_ID= /DNA_START= /DNA_END= /DNA_ORIENTATION=